MRAVMRHGWRLSATVTGLGAVTVVTVLVLALMWTFGWGWFSATTAELRGQQAQRERVEAGGDYRIAAYEHFFDLCAAVQSKESTIAQLEAELPGADQRRAEQVRTTLTALRSSRASAIHEYNADARKAATTGRFRDLGLPRQLDIEEETSCVPRR
ncbi:putative Zn-dependent peptidase [Saccharomonospora amisosensis]|uniref:Putative Zn-dependent peptidase n=1 Tax=Saccharomonospora amisosensis TaxID=1128677 RepID=A0A7X5UNZ3_9PSEU|nr:hypothetical protein [Saccharomonospora amisosensis]NIJ11128.1 putative Zn-dependent peptidase [Saccharomonospora amisosensis]